MKLLASHLGGTRNPMFVSWPGHIEPDPVPRTQFHHVVDLVPTIYEILGISHPETVNGVPQDPIDGTSLAYSIDDAGAEGRRRTQYFEIMGSRSIYSDGWMASATGPRLPWVQGMPAGIQTWTPDQDRWELYHLDEDWSQAHDLAADHPEKLAELKELFAIEAARNDALPVGGGLWVPVMHPEDRISPRTPRGTSRGTPCASRSSARRRWATARTGSRSGSPSPTPRTACSTSSGARAAG